MWWPCHLISNVSNMLIWSWNPSKFRSVWGISASFMFGHFPTFHSCFCAPTCLSWICLTLLMPLHPRTPPLLISQTRLQMQPLETQQVPHAQSLLLTTFHPQQNLNTARKNQLCFGCERYPKIELFMSVIQKSKHIRVHEYISMFFTIRWSCK